VSIKPVTWLIFIL